MAAFYSPKKLNINNIPIEAKIFRNFEREYNIGVSAGDRLIMLGREEEYRRTKQTLEEYINERPKLPEEIAPKEEFYL